MFDFYHYQNWCHETWFFSRRGRTECIQPAVYLYKCPDLTEQTGCELIFWACYVILKHKKSVDGRSQEIAVQQLWGVQSTLGSLRIPRSAKGAEGELLSATISWPLPGTQTASPSSAAGFAKPITSTEGTTTAVWSELILEK